MYSRDLALNVNKPEQRRLLEELTLNSSVPPSAAANPWRTVRDFTLEASAGTPVPVPQVRAILQQAHRLTSLSLFSVSLMGSRRDFEDWAEVLHMHRHLREVHFVDCCIKETCSTRSRACDDDDDDAVTDGSFANLSMEDDDDEMEDQSVTTLQEACRPSGRPMMDCILVALSTIPTLQNVEIYAVPTLQDHDDDDGTIMSTSEDEEEEDLLEMSDVDSPAGMRGPSVISTTSSSTVAGPLVLAVPSAPRQGLTSPRQSSRRTQSSPNGGMRMSPGAIATLCAASPSLRSLSLEDFDLHDEHVALISLALATNRTLLNLKLWGCNITDRGSAALAQMLFVNGALQKLDLSNNDIQDDGCIAIAEALRYHPTLRWLSLAGNDCVIRHLPLPPTMSDRQGAVPESRVSNSRGLGFDALRQMLRENPVIEDLILDDYEREMSLTEVIEGNLAVPVAE